jgi:hypothetical protein
MVVDVLLFIRLNVISIPFFSRYDFGWFGCVGLVALLHFCLALCGWENANVLPNALVFCSVIVQLLCNSFQCVKAPA